MAWPQTGSSWPCIKNNHLAHYRVRVQGVVSESNCDIFGNMTFEEESDAGQQHVTTLTAQYQDQAVLMAALDFPCDRRLAFCSATICPV